jgi:hypothetical protein
MKLNLRIQLFYCLKDLKEEPAGISCRLFFLSVEGKRPRSALPPSDLFGFLFF